MRFDWTEFLRLSEGLAGIAGAAPSEEAKLRTAISRAYYSAFCATRDYLANAGEFVPSGRPDDHTLVQDCLEGGDRDRRKIRGRLGRLRIRRNRADYEGHFSSPRQVAVSMIKAAQEVEESLTRIRQAGGGSP